MKKFGQEIKLSEEPQIMLMEKKENPNEKVQENTKKIIGWEKK